jgi:hypothetical protein
MSPADDDLLPGFGQKTPRSVGEASAIRTAPAARRGTDPAVNNMQRHYVNDIEPMSVWRYADTRLRGRPPFAPLALEAAAFAFDRRRPPRRPVAAANKRVPNTRSTRPGT